MLGSTYLVEILTGMCPSIDNILQSSTSELMDVLFCRNRGMPHHLEGVGIESRFFSVWWY